MCRVGICVCICETGGCMSLCVYMYIYIYIYMCILSALFDHQLVRIRYSYPLNYHSSIITAYYHSTLTPCDIPLPKYAGSEPARPKKEHIFTEFSTACWLGTSTRLHIYISILLLTQLQMLQWLRNAMNLISVKSPQTWLQIKYVILSHEVHIYELLSHFCLMNILVHFVKSF